MNEPPNSEVPPIIAATEPTPGNTHPLAVAVGAKKDVWGLWATLGLVAVIGIGMIAAQIAAGVAFVLFSMAVGTKLDASKLEQNGLFLSIATCCSGPVIAALAWLFASLRKGLRPRDYLALRPVKIGSVMRWCLVLAIVVTISDAVTALLGRPIVPQFMRDIYASAGFLPLLWIVLLVVAPVSEEIVFRGFLFQGLARSPLGSLGAIGISAGLWAGIHLQYDLYGMSSVFLGGLVLGYARCQTNSVFTSMIMHGLMNLIATVELIGQGHLHWLPP